MSPDYLKRTPKLNTYQIVVLSGDGIGPEIVDAALQVLETLQRQVGHFRLDYRFHEAGAASTISGPIPSPDNTTI